MNFDLTNVASVYADGGVLKRNPSADGATFAFVFLDATGQELGAGSGYIWPDVEAEDERRQRIELLARVWNCDLPAITNNVSELCAIVFALQDLPDGFAGTVYTDSWVSLCRMVNAKSWNGVPDALRQAVMVERARHPHATYKLLDGHPTPEQLKANRGCRGNPVSEWNVKCDLECNRLSAVFFNPRICEGDRWKNQKTGKCVVILECDGVTVSYKSFVPRFYVGAHRIRESKFAAFLKNFVFDAGAKDGT